MPIYEKAIRSIRREQKNRRSVLNNRCCVNRILSVLILKNSDKPLCSTVQMLWQPLLGHYNVRHNVLILII